RTCGNEFRRFCGCVSPASGRGSALPIRHISSSGSMARALAAVQPAADDSPPLASEAAITEVEAVRRRLVRLAFDVHDGPMQNLAAAGYSVHELNRRLKSSQALDVESVSFDLDQIVSHLAG